MTRISSYTLYHCPSCGQVHIKNEYSSVSIYVPTDLHLDPTDQKACKNCGKFSQVKDYICLGTQPKTVRVERTYQNNMWGRIHKKLYEFFSSPKEVDLSNLYPYI
jgi:predicted RNA-binding Zn-ribbon protein involved in translation (DUF1610 family)